MENRDLIVFPIDKNERSSVKWEKDSEYDIMKTDTKLRGGDNMHQETYSKNEIDLKFENLSDRMDNKFELLSQKLIMVFQIKFYKLITPFRNSNRR
ncbi:MAG: hypothetical protein ACLRQF_15645 [Thomasclavelia ramosa]